MRCRGLIITSNRKSRNSNNGLAEPLSSTQQLQWPARQQYHCNGSRSRFRRSNPVLLINPDGNACQDAWSQGPMPDPRCDGAKALNEHAAPFEGNSRLRSASAIIVPAQDVSAPCIGTEPDFPNDPVHGSDAQNQW